MKLSILIPSIPERSPMLERLLITLRVQVNYCNDVHKTLGGAEIIIDNSEKYLNGGLSIGRKRSKLVFEARGEYLCFLDDDESISPDYVETLLRLCNQGKDVCTFRSFARLEPYWCIIEMGLNNENEEAHPGIVLRKPWHICPVNSFFAKLYQFQDKNYGEDWGWMEQVLQHCKTEAKSSSILHEYHHGIHSESDKIVRYESLTESGTTGHS